MGTSLRSLALGLLVAALLGGSNLDSPMAEGNSGRAHGVEYVPLLPGAHFLYQETGGGQFAREVMRPTTVIWFDGSTRQVTPVYDGRLDGYFLYETVGSEVRVIGAFHTGQLDRWGEYVPVMTPLAVEVAHPITTPAGQFGQARVMHTGGMTAWYAKEVGLVRTDSFELLSYTRGSPRSIDL